MNEAEDIDGSDFVELTQNDLIGINIVLGRAKKVMRVVRANQDEHSGGNVPPMSLLEDIVTTVLVDGGNLELPSDDIIVISDVEMDGDTEPVSDEDSEQTSTCNRSQSRYAVRTRKRQFRQTSQPAPLAKRQKVDPQFSKYGSVMAVVVQHKQGDIIQRAIAKQFFTEPERRLLVSITTNELVQCHGNYYPPSEKKEALAKAIVTEIPILKHVKGLGYEHYYDPITRRDGFIEYKLCNLRKYLRLDEKVYNKVNPKGCGSKRKSSDDSDAEPNGAELRLQMSWDKPDSHHKTGIKKGMDLTYNSRRSWINRTKPPASDSIAAYPRIADYEGEMVDGEFEKLFPNSAINIITEYVTTLVPQILAYSRQAEPKMFVEVQELYRDHEDKGKFGRIILCADVLDNQFLFWELDSFVAMMLLMRLIHPWNLAKSDKQNTHNEIQAENNKKKSEKPVPDQSRYSIEFISGLPCRIRGTQLYAAERRHKTKTSIQPYMI
ncbi:hypothetical protein QAD02_018389 [Eretmocerus hayati]|uniref:Uncharacterized protein n=1 Tax=Eretmocerus hayati TaxID=131215 RepID=A0ACC2PGW6_9HYME|nr:hypothetical protein QAD02_018389 [Eretmocerus hayati]